MTTGAVKQYAHDIVHRGRIPMAPFDYEVDWQDQPRRHKYYPGAIERPFPMGGPVAETLAQALDRPRWEGRGQLDPTHLARVLNDAYGLLARRLRVTGNDDALGKPMAINATYSRGTANGGGLYPLEFYWVKGSSALGEPGIHAWCSASGNLRRIGAGDASAAVRDALGNDPALGDQFLLVTVKLWKNSFKYNSFTHHVVTMDLGATLASLELLGLPGNGERILPRLWFDSRRADMVLGLDSLDETTLAIIPLPNGPLPLQPRAAHPSGLVVECERSRTTRRFSQVSAVVEATIALPSASPDASAVSSTAGPSGGGLDLPQRLGSTRTVSELLRRRRSSFGTFAADGSLDLAELGTLLWATSTGAKLRTDAGTPNWSRVFFFANTVDGLSRGAYFYDPESHRVHQLTSDDPRDFLQRAYFLDNYNTEHAAAVITVTAPISRVVDQLGDRALRLVNACVGSATQLCYLAAADLDLACGAALGFDNVSYSERLALEDADEWPLIMLMVGRDRSTQADLSLELSPIGGVR